MAQYLGQKAALKSLATAQGKAAIRKLMDNENVDLNDLVKAVLTDGPALLNVNLNDVQKLVQENKLPNNDNIIRDVFDYIQSHLYYRKNQFQSYYMNNHHSIKPNEIEYIRKQLNLCDKHGEDMSELKQKIQWELERSTRASVYQWVRHIMFYEWSTCTMHENRKKHDHVLKLIMPKYNPPPPRSRTTQPKKDRKKKTKTTPNKAKLAPGTTLVGRTVCFTGAPEKSLVVFKKICYFYNWRYEGCMFSEKECKGKHICSEEGCGANHPAHDHK